MHQLDQQFRRRLLDDVYNSSLDTCVRWAAARIFMQKNANEPKLAYSLKRYPYMREPLNSRARRTWVMKGAQVGFTTGGMVRALFEVDYHGRDVMYLMPIDKVAALLSKTRLSALIQTSDYLKCRFTDTTEVKQRGVASLFVRGANGDINVKSTPVSRLFLDEVDEMTAAQIRLALERLSGADDPMAWGMSTPKFPQTGVHALYLTSTQEHFFFKCPHCGNKIELSWPESFVVKGEDVTDPRCWDSHIRCHLPSCHGELPHKQKTQWLVNGWWEPTAADPNPEVRGFGNLNQMYSPTVEPGEIAMAWHAGRAEEAARAEFYRSKAAMPYVEDGAQVLDEHIDKCLKVVEPYALDADMPRSGDKSLFTLGIDQGKFHHWSVVKWALNFQIPGDVNDKATGKLVACGTIPQDNWDEFGELMRMWQIRAAVMDFYPDQTNARRVARKFAGFLWPCQYITGRTAREIKVEQDEYGIEVAKVDKTGWTNRALGRVMTQSMALPANLPLRYRQQLKGQVREYRRGPDGNYIATWTKIGEDHFGHSLTYAEIALHLMNPSLFMSDTLSNIRG